MIILEEILMANGLAILMMWFLLLCRRKNRESLHMEDKLYDGMAVMNLLGALAETTSFLIDGKSFAGSRALNLFSNSVCFLGTVTIGFLWCLYVELRIYRNYRRIFRKVKILMLPWLAEAVAILCNVLKPGILFRISADNVYERAGGAVLGYISLMLYFAYSLYLVYHSKRRGVNLNFFPVQFFVGPCIAGVLIQLCFYGITSSWISVSIALTFVQMQSYAENLYTDELSGLYNRRYFNAVLEEKERMKRKALHGIMMDVNDFKSINDKLGHSMGDRAICTLANILCRSIPDSGIAIRYAGDEFIVLLQDVEADCAFATMKEIQENLEKFNDSKAEPFALSVSMGYTKFRTKDTAETFLNRMDAKMYEEKRRYHLMKQSNS